MADKGKTDTAKFINLQDKINNDIGKIKANLESFRKRNAEKEEKEENNQVFKNNKDRFARLKEHLQKIKNNYINYLTRKQIGTTLGLVISEQLKEKERIRQEEEAERKRLQEEEDERIRQEERRKQDEEEERLRRQEEEKGRLNDEFEKIISSINKNLEEINTLSNGLDKEEKEVKDFSNEKEHLVEMKNIKEHLYPLLISNYNGDKEEIGNELIELRKLENKSVDLLEKLKQIIEYLKTKHEKASIALALSINISNEEKRKKIEEEKKRKEEEERKEKELQEKLKRLSEEEAERVLQKIRKEKEQTQIAVAITNSIQLQEKIKNLQNKLQDLFDQRKDKITEFEEMYNKLKDLLTEFKPLYTKLENYLPENIKESSNTYHIVENQIKLALEELHKDENNAIPTTIEQLNEKVNEIATNIEEINSIKKATENLIEKTYELIKSLKLIEETIYKNKVNELTSIGLGLAVSEKINEEKEIDQIVNKIDVFDDYEAEEVEDKEEEEIEKEKKLLEKELNMIAIGLQNTIKNVIEDENRKKLEEEKRQDEERKAIEEEQKRKAMEKEKKEKELNMIAIGLQNVIKNVIEDENRKKLEEEERKKMGKEEEREKERQEEEKRKLDELFERKMKEQEERELEQELVSIALPLTIKNKLDAEKMALNIPLEDLNKNNLQTALTIALNEAITKKNKKGTKKLDQKKINALLAVVSTLLMLLVKSRKPKQDNKSTDIQTNTVTDRDVNEQEKILYARRQEEDVLNDHLHEVCVNAFNEQFKMGEVLPTTGPRQRPIYSSHDDEFCYGLIVNEEQDPSGNYYQTSIRNVKCPFNKTYVEGRDKGGYKSGKCIDASVGFVRESKGDNEKKDPDTKSEKSPGEPLNKEEENTSKSDKITSSEQEISKNDKKIIKKEPGSPEIKKEFVDEKKNSEREKEIIQNGLALAIINNLKN
jgi:trichohyalin